jgi:hypothetical protein
MTMSEMIERVARALCVDAHGGNLSPDAILTCGPASEVGQPAWKFFEKRAHAAITAMREPTKEMLRAGFVRVNVSTEERPEGLLNPWHGMIDEALK